jgi:hypothetical protein
MPMTMSENEQEEQQGLIPSLIINPSADFIINVFSSPSTQQIIATAHN